MKITLRHIQILRVKSADGTAAEYHYFRAPGRPRVRLPHPSNPEFMVAYQKASGAERLKPKGGTLGSVIEHYYSSLRFKKLAERSKKDYRRLLSNLDPLREMPLAEVTTDFIEKLQLKFLERLKWRSTNYLLDIFRSAWRVAMKTKLVNDDPFLAISDVPRPADLPARNRRWDDAELDAALALAKQRKLWGLRAALALGAYTGMRRSDMLSVTWDALKGSRFVYKSHKTRVDVDIEMTPALAAILKSTPRSKTVANIVINDQQQPYTENGLNSSLKKLRARLIAAGAVDASGLSLHGLRHTVGGKLAEAGASEFAIKAVLGHATTAMAQKYTRTAEQRRLGSASSMLARKSKRLSRGKQLSTR